MVIAHNILSVAALAATFIKCASAEQEKYLSYNGLAMTPPMGWNNWATFFCNVSADLLVGTAEKLVELGFKDVGYNYVVLDDCWSNGRDSNGALIPDAEKFPKGMKDVSDQIHAKGLLFGMYSSAGRWTCAGYEGSLGHEEIDAQSLAEWEVDYFKYDNCFNDGQYGTPLISYNRYQKMSEALLNTGRDIVYSMCNWGEDSPWDWAPTIANSWRISGDMYDSFDRPDEHCPCDGDEYICKLGGYHCSMNNILNKAAKYASKTRRGAWNDLDMLEVGNGGSTDDEYKTHFSMWAALKSPLMMATDIRKIDPDAYTIYTNPAVLAISQDPRGSSVGRVWRRKIDGDVNDYGVQGELSLWSGQLWGDDQVVALVNTGSQAVEMTATLAEIFYHMGPGGKAKEIKEEWDVYDLWGNRMDSSTAQDIVAGKIKVDNNLIYNASEQSYAQGLLNGDPRLLGKKVTTIKPSGSLSVKVNSHGVGFFRLRRPEPVKVKEFL